MARMALLKQASEVTGLSQWELRTGAKSGKYPHLEYIANIMAVWVILEGREKEWKSILPVKQ